MVRITGLLPQQLRPDPRILGTRFAPSSSLIPHLGLMWQMRQISRMVSVTRDVWACLGSSKPPLACLAHSLCQQSWMLHGLGCPGLPLVQL